MSGETANLRFPYLPVIDAYRPLSGSRTRLILAMRCSGGNFNTSAMNRVMSGTIRGRLPGHPMRSRGADTAHEGNSRTMGMHADEKSDGCIVPVKPRTMPSDIGGGDGGGTAPGQGEGELRCMLPTQRRNTHVTEAASPRIGARSKKGRAATMTHDYKRNGTTTLFAALDVKTGLAIGECHPRHRAKEFIRFLKRIDRCVQTHLDIHLVLDNYGTHKTPAVKRWLAKHDRFHLHFTPTSASWLSLVERFFAEITQKRIRRGTFTSVDELKDAIHDYLDRHNADPKPFVWTKSAEVILENERRALDRLEAIKVGTRRQSRNTSEFGT